MNWKRIWISLWLLALLATFIVTLVNHSPYFLLGGSSSVAPVMEELLNKYPDNHKKGDFNYVSSASSGAPTRVESGLFGIGWLSKEYKTENPGCFTFQLMRDGLIIVYNIPRNNLVHPNTPLNFTSDQVKQLYLNNKTWQEVFPNDVKDFNIKPKTFTRPNGSGTRDVFDKEVLDGTTYYQANTIDSSSGMLNLESGSIGYSSFADFQQAKAIDVTAGTWNGTEATAKNIDNKTYQLWRPFTGVINYSYKHKLEIVKLLQWIFITGGSEVNNIFEKYGPQVGLEEPENDTLKSWLEGWPI